jgi:hypothetical protein
MPSPFLLQFFKVMPDCLKFGSIGFDLAIIDKLLIPTAR